MKRFFQKNGIMMLAAVVVVAVGLCIASAVSNQTGFLQNAAGVYFLDIVSFVANQRSCFVSSA